MNYSSRCSKATGRSARWPTRSTPRCAARCAWRRAAGRPRAGDRLRLGRAGRDGGAASSAPQRHRRDAVHRAAGVCQERMQRRAWPTAARPAPAGLPRHRDGPSTPSLDRDVRGRGPRILAHLLRRPWRACSSRRPRLHPEHHHPRRPVRALPALHRLHPAVHLPGRPAAQPAAPSAPRPSAPGWRWSRARLRPDYAETLRRWREQFLARDTPVRKLGFDDRFMRIWEFYLAYCEAAFATGNTDVVQFTLQRPLKAP
jgi:hypothetical protein